MPRIPGLFPASARLRRAERLPQAFGRGHAPLADFQLGVHEDERARAPHDLAVRLDEFADLHRVDAVHVELHRRLRHASIGVPAGHAHGAVGEGHEHAALHHAAAVMVLYGGQKGVAEAVAGRTRPERADEPDEAFVLVGFPAVGGGVERDRHQRSGMAMRRPALSGCGSRSCAPFIAESERMTLSGKGATFLVVMSTWSVMFSEVAEIQPSEAWNSCSK